MYSLSFLLLSGDASKGKVLNRITIVPTNLLETLTDKQFKREFPFSKADKPRLLHCLQWPQFFRMNNRLSFSAEICLLMILYRFAFASTLANLEIMFGRSESICS